MDAQHMNQQTFAASIGISNATLSSIFTGRTNPTNKIVEAIHNTYPTVRTDWLMWGTGPMFAIGDGTTALPSSGDSESGIGDLFSSANMSARTQSTNPANGASAMPPAGQHGTRQNPSSFQNSSSGASNLEGGKKMISNSEISQLAQLAALSSPSVAPQRKITEIRVFYDDQTWESFTPKK